MYVDKEIYPLMMKLQKFGLLITPQALSILSEDFLFSRYYAQSKGIDQVRKR